MASNEALIGILIFLILTVGIIIAIVTTTKTSAPPTNNPSQLTTTAFLSPCENVPCGDGLVCDNVSFTCKIPPSYVCYLASDCVNGYFCSGRCTTGTTGGLDMYCPCLPGYLCDQQEDGYSICKGASGTDCTIGTDCFSLSCVNNTCLGGFPNAYPCFQNSDCDSKNCNSSFCQPQPTGGFQTGSLGSACADNCVGWTGSTCQVPGSFCNCLNGPNEPGICMEFDIGFLIPCVPEVGICANIFQCSNIGGTGCTFGQTGCMCEFPYPNQSVITPGLQCIGGMTAGVGGQTCLNNIGIGCNQNYVCDSGVCGGPSVLTTFSFNSKIQPSFIGATGMEVLRVNHGPTAPQNIVKLWGTSSGYIDTIYLLDRGLGIYTMTYNTNTQSVITDWVNTPIPIPIPDSQVIFDVAYNGTTYLVLYQQYIPTGGVYKLLYSGTDTRNLLPVPTQQIPLIPFVDGMQDVGFQQMYANILSVDISSANDASTGGDILLNVYFPYQVPGDIDYAYTFTKQATESPENIPYTPVTVVYPPYPASGLISPGSIPSSARFYYDIEEVGSSGTTAICTKDGNLASPGASIKCPSIYNIGFIGGNDMGYPNISTLLGLQFVGNLSPVILPYDIHTSSAYTPQSYSVYSPPGIGMQGSSIITLSSAPGTPFGENLSTVLTYFGVSGPLPYVIGTASPSQNFNPLAVLATANAYYVFSIGSCS
jgi:hypothetical protein